MRRPARGGSLSHHIKACFGDRAPANVRNQLTLPDHPIDYSVLPDALMLILFSSRSGSTYAGQLLANTPYFNRVGESFNPAQLERVRAREGHADHGETLRWLISDRATSRAFASKCGEPGLISAWHLGFLDACIDRTTFLMLERRDLVAQAVSLFRAKLSGRYHSPQKAKREVHLDEYDRDQIAKELAVIERVNQALRNFLELNEKAYRTVYYEDICDNPDGFVRDACMDLNLPAPDQINSEVHNVILRDELSMAWIERFKKER